ncbi:hypothetical protein D3C80_2123920 [compost metagenome]
MPSGESSCENLISKFFPGARRLISSMVEGVAEKMLTWPVTADVISVASSS